VRAQEFAMLDQIAEGRAVLGLGSSGANVIEHLHSVPFAAPLRRICETVEIFDLLIAGEKLDDDGEIFQLHRGFSSSTLGCARRSRFGLQRSHRDRSSRPAQSPTV
jgi:alkanesulfonate monooxygenase SsuD/methylene tetrahydromethanopterin reductase-like flavin-dependent oxidoreductase (luciferase family)